VAAAVWLKCWETDRGKQLQSTGALYRWDSMDWTRTVLQWRPHQRVLRLSYTGSWDTAQQRSSQCTCWVVASLLPDYKRKKPRLILEYCTPVWHYSLMRTQAQQLEAIEKRAIHVILNLSRGMSYSSMFFATDLESLADRRENVSRNFFLGITKPSSCLHHLLPPQGQIPPPQGSGHTKNIQGSILTRMKRYCSFINYNMH